MRDLGSSCISKVVRAVIREIRGVPDESKARTPGDAKKHVLSAQRDFVIMCDLGETLYVDYYSLQEISVLGTDLLRGGSQVLL